MYVHDAIAEIYRENGTEIASKSIVELVYHIHLTFQPHLFANIIVEGDALKMVVGRINYQSANKTQRHNFAINVPYLCIERYRHLALSVYLLNIAV